jgi:hypothetical protein
VWSQASEYNQSMMHPFLAALVWTIGVLGITVVLCHLFPRLGKPGQSVAAWLCRAPGLDLLVTIFTVLPLFAGFGIWSWWGLLGGWIGQYAVLFGWVTLHGMAHPERTHGPRMWRVHNRLIGPLRNISSLVVTSFAAPTFWFIRITELLFYPFLVYVTKFPAYKQSEWVNVTRQKYDGLVGHDRIWCLYCDWMTGVWSLGGEMLRNVESFWCPIRFGDATKCENCKHDFPDVVGGWAPENGTVKDGVAALVREYEAEPRPLVNAWFGHPVRMTVKGKDVTGQDVKTP